MHKIKDKEIIEFLNTVSINGSDVTVHGEIDEIPDNVDINTGTEILAVAPIITPKNGKYALDMHMCAKTDFELAAGVYKKVLGSWYYLNV